MVPTKYQMLITSGNVLTGSSASLTSQWATKIESEGIERIHFFIHPFIQAYLMCLAEFSCLLLYTGKYFYEKLYNKEDNLSIPFNPLLFLLPAVLDLLASTTIFIALKLTITPNTSLISGTVLIFTAILSRKVLSHPIPLPKICGILIIVLDGYFLLGVGDLLPLLYKDLDINGLVAGDLLIFVTQIFRALQVIYEEVVIKKYNVPSSKAIGLEGLFGLLILTTCLIPFYYTDGGRWFHNNPMQRIEDPFDALCQISSSNRLIIAVICYFIAAVLFNLSCACVIKEYNALTRMICDSMKLIPIYSVTLFVGWQPLSPCHIAGILLLVFGLSVYLNITIVPLCSKYVFKRDSERENLLERF